MTRWDFRWLFSTVHNRREPGPHSEHGTLALSGDVHRPAPFRYAQALIELIVRAVLPDPREEFPPRSIGFLNARSDRLHGYVTVPESRLAALTAAAGRIRLVSLIATRLVRSRGMALGIHVDTHFDPEE